MILVCLMPTQTQRRHQDWRSLQRRLSAALALCLMVFLQVAPGIAGAAAKGEWVEICSEFGVILKQVALNGDSLPEGENKNDVPCPLCAACAFCAALESEGILPEQHQARAGIGGRCSRALRALQNVAANPAQFWPDNRGPPLGTQHKQAHLRASPKASIQTVGGAFWA